MQSGTHLMADQSPLSRVQLIDSCDNIELDHFLEFVDKYSSSFFLKAGSLTVPMEIHDLLNQLNRRMRIVQNQIEMDNLFMKNKDVFMNSNLFLVLNEIVGHVSPITKIDSLSEMSIVLTDYLNGIKKNNKRKRCDLQILQKHLQDNHKTYIHICFKFSNMNRDVFFKVASICHRVMKNQSLSYEEEEIAEKLIDFIEQNQFC